ncbi:MAG: hypothetical protein RL307_161 [Pseudomonadota bacterium]|jgi:short-subunit dehydrogenase
MIEIPVAVVTGASDGIGAALAELMAKHSERRLFLVLCGRDKSKLARVALLCQQHGASVLEITGDLRQEEDCRRLISSTISRFGRIDTLVCNAGVSGHALLEEVKAEEMQWFEDMMRINFWSAVWCTHAALPWLRQHQGRLVAVSSLAGLAGVPGRTAYCASKFALNGFMEALRTELPPDEMSITVAYPGVVDTQIRQKGYNSKGQSAGSSGLREHKAMAVKQCARLIHEAMMERDREVVMTWQGKLGRWIKLIAPDMVDKMAKEALQKPLNAARDKASGVKSN